MTNGTWHKTLMATGCLAALGGQLPATAASAVAVNEITLRAAADGDVNYAFNSRYGPTGYTQGGSALNVGLYFGAPYGNDYTLGIIELPIAALATGELISAELKVESLGFDTNYYYGSAGLSWLNVGALTLSGDPQADGLGALLSGSSISWKLFDSGNVAGTAGWFSFDVSTQVQADLDAGRSYSTFVLAGSRDTYGGIYAAEALGDRGARLVAMSTAAAVPEPGSWALMLAGLGIVGLLAKKARNRP